MQFLIDGVIWLSENPHVTALLMAWSIVGAFTFTLLLAREAVDGTFVTIVAVIVCGPAMWLSFLLVLMIILVIIVKDVIERVLP